MCTLSFIPIKNGTVITTNRDESPQRNSHNLSGYLSALEEKYLIAQEPLRGGTNIAIGEKSRTAVLLNGAFDRHDMNKTYGISRGIVTLKSLDLKDLYAFADRFDFDTIQPFTLVHFGTTIQEIRWDGMKIYKNEFSVNQPKIWSSPQLYLPAVRKQRAELFESFLKNGEMSPESIAHFHFTAGIGDKANDFVMNRNGKVQTVSISQIAEINKEKKIVHWDLVEKTKMDYDFDIS